MSKLSEIIERNRLEKLTAHDDDCRPKQTPNTSRLHIRLDPETIDLLKRISILTGMKRQEVLRFALREFSATIRPDLLESKK